MEKRTIRIAYLDNTRPKKKVDKGLFKGGEADDRLSALKNVRENGVSIDPVIIDPFPFPLNPLRNQHALYAGLDPLRAFRVLAKINKYDAIVAVGESSGFVFLALKFLLKIKTPVLILDPAISLGWKSRKKILDFVLPRADRLLVYGTNQADFIKMTWGEKCCPEVILHAIDTNFFVPSAEATENYIFSIGNDIGRDFDTLIEAGKNINSKIIIKTQIPGLLDKDMPQNVSLIRPRISFEELKKLYKKSKFVVMPLKNCQHASGVNSVLEAMAMGKALIVSESDGIKDYVKHNETALLVDPGNVTELKEKIEFLLKRPNEVERLGKNARKFVEENCSRLICANKFFRLIIKSLKDR